MRTQSQRLTVELARAALLSPWCKIAPSTSSPFVSSSSSLSSAIMRRMPFPQTHRSFITDSNSGADPNQLDAIFKQKWALRSKIRKALKDMSSIQRSQEGGHPASRKKVYVPRVEDKFSNMKMLKVTNVDELVMSSMNILEPALLDSDGIQREDVMQACEPVDLVILPGLAFDCYGRRLGRSGGYYDLFLKNYEELAKKKNWKQPLLVALAYSVQIMDEGAIAVTPNDVSVDAFVSPGGYIPISAAARLG